MKKFNFFILLIILTLFYTINSYAQNEYIKVGISKYKNSNNIPINNSNILIGTTEKGGFNLNLKLSSENGFNIKPLLGIYIRANLNFYNYDDALNYSLNYKNMYPALENDKWTTYIGEFTSNSEAQDYIEQNSITGEILNLSNCIGIFNKSKAMSIFNIKNGSLQIKGLDDKIFLETSSYRNIIEFRIIDNRLFPINVVNIEEYLYGVVPAEMPFSWHSEALKAQAVASRNYVYSNLGMHSSENYDVCDTVHCQVYKGGNVEKESTNKAVNETKGIFAYHNNKRINAVYSSSNGGYSENSENVWNEKLDYLRAVEDKNEEGGKVWTRKFTYSELTNLAKDIGEVKEVILENSPETGRVITLTLVGSTGRKVLKKEEIRTFFSRALGGSLESRNFRLENSNSSDKEEYKIFAIANTNKYEIDLTKNINVISSKGILQREYTGDIISKNGNTQYDNNKEIGITNNTNSSTITFYGKGWGHGVGMSQYGANSLGKKGYKYDEILKYYYTGIEVR